VLIPAKGRIRGWASIEISKLRLDIVLDLKRLNAHLDAAAYPILKGVAIYCRAG
jgi:Na+/phosphate symporter